MGLSKKHVAFWVAWLVAFLLVELPAVGDGAGDGDTFSELIYWLRDLHPMLKAGLLGLWAWLGWHFFVQGRDRDEV